MKRLLAILSLITVVSGAVAPSEDSGHAVGPPFTVHGRLWIARNGTLAPRIWIVGTKRILDVPPAYGSDPVYLPRKLNRLAWDYYIFADFTVVPFTKDEPGVMRKVRIVSAENVVVTDWNLNFLYRIERKIDAEEARP